LTVGSAVPETRAAGPDLPMLGRNGSIAPNGAAVSSFTPAGVRGTAIVARTPGAESVKMPRAVPRNFRGHEARPAFPRMYFGKSRFSMPGRLRLI